MPGGPTPAMHPDRDIYRAAAILEAAGIVRMFAARMAAQPKNVLTALREIEDELKDAAWNIRQAHNRRKAQNTK